MKKKIRRPQQYHKKEDPTLKEWWAAQTERTRKTIIYALIALAAVIVIILVWYYGFYEDGSLKIRNSAVVGKEDNWLIAKLTDGKNSEYYKMGTMDVPEGYVTSESSLAGTSTSTSYKTDFTFDPDESNTSGVEHIYVTGVAKSMNDMLDSVYDTFKGIALPDEDEEETTEESVGAITEIKELGENKYFIYQYSYTNDDTSATEYAQSMVLYVPGNYANSCVLVSVTCSPETPDGFLSEEVMVAEVQKALDKLTLDEIK